MAALESMTPLSAPLLESLSLFTSVYSGMDQNKPLDIGDWAPPRLQEVSLARIYVSWSPKILCNLKTIKLKDIKYGGPSFSQLCAVLSASPSLAWLSIAAVGFPHEPSTLPPDPIHMQNLRKLQFSDIPLRITKGFLAAIRAPKCEFGGLEGDIRGDPFETFFTPEISHFFDHMRSGVTASSIRSNGHVATISWKGSWRITLDVNGTRAARRVLDWLSEPNSRAVPLHLTIDANNSRQVGEVLAVMVDAVDQVTFQYGAPVARALRVLATGSLVDGPAREPPHALKEVYIGKSLNDDEWEQLSSMLRQRQGEGGIGDQDLKPIRRLELDRLGYPYRELTEADINSFRLILWPNHLQEIRRLLGPEGELVWREKIVRQDGVLVDRHTEDRDLNGRTRSQCEEELGILRSIQKQLERRAASVSRKRNSFAPINALPLELLVTIFKITVGDEESRRWSIHERLLLVCHDWNHVVNNTPSLWTRIRKTIVSPNAKVIHALQKYQDSPLEIECDLTGEMMETVGGNAFLNAIFPHAHRWRKATSRLEDTVALEPMTSLSAPLLESLSLFTSRWSPRERNKSLDIFGGRPPPRLQEVSLRSVCVTWSPTTLCNLKTLEIQDIRYLGPSFSQLCAVLSASPNLETLSIRDVWFSDDTSTPPQIPIHMPNLSELLLSDIQQRITEGLLAAFRAPKCKFGKFSAQIKGDPFETFFTPNISHFFDNMRSGAMANSIGFYGSSTTIFWEGAWRITLHLDDIRVARSVLGWFSEPNSGAAPLHLKIHAIDLPGIEEALAVMVDAVHQVTFQYRTPVAGALKLLANSGLVDGPAREPPHALEEVCICKSLDYDEWEQLLGMLRKRQGEGRDGDQDLKPLRRLRLEDQYAEDKDAEIS
ncbi:hypothetical protein FRC01_007890, partial [Tulasnella sp. 417]